MESNIRFGFSQYFKNPTPDKIRMVVKTVSVCLGAMITWVSAVHFIPDVYKADINETLGGIITLIHLVAPLWGVEIDSPTVPTDKVTAVKE